MHELRQQFKTSSVENLELLRQKITETKNFSDNFLQEIFRQIHTVKGTAQTFGFENSSRIAHKLEDVLSAVKNGQSILSKKLLLESVETLKKSFNEKDAENADDLIEKLKTTASSRTNSRRDLPKLPENILSSLSASELETLSVNFSNGKNIYCLQVYFPTANFREKLLKFREILEKNGEIVATLSAAKKDSLIGFRFLFAGEFRDIAEEFSPKIVFDFARNNLPPILEKIKDHGERLADKLGKQIEFEISALETPLSDEKIIFDVLLHLIRNSIDHAIEKPAERRRNGKRKTGKITINFLKENDDLKIIVADDGRGIDAEKIKLKAIGDGLISEDDVLDKWEILNLIFLSGISTAENITDISGRGVGLNAVKKIVEDAGGIIKVESRKEIGTTFEIVLPIKI